MIKHISRSLTFHLALMFSLSALAVLLLLGFAVLYAVNQHFISQDRMMLATQSQHVTHTLHSVDDIATLPKQLTAVTTGMAHSEHGFSLLIVDDHGNILFNGATNEAALVSPAMLQTALASTLSSWHEAGNSYRLLSQPITLVGEPATLIIALNINHHQTFLDSFKYSMWISIAIAALLMGLLACIVAQKGLTPLRTLIQQTKQITVNNLSQRLPTANSYSEIEQLTRTFNAMLDRLHHSFQRLIGFSSDLAHELRTPLSTMKMQNQVMLSRPRTVGEYQKALQDKDQALDQLTRMVTDMLFLAKSDNGLIKPDAAPFALHDEVASLLDFYDYLAQDKNMTLHLSGQAMLSGDKNLLRRALSNLIANAINYGDKSSCVDINLTEQAGQVTITVQNQGDTIEPQHLPHLFERFYRVDSARTQTSDGVGLGLAITASIVQAHWGKIKVSSANRLTCFSLTFTQHKA